MTDIERHYAQSAYAELIEQGRSAWFIFEVARMLMSMADAQIMAELKRQAESVPVTKIGPVKTVEEKDADGRVEDKWTFCL